MPQDPTPPESLQGRRLRLLGVAGSLCERRYYLTDDGAVWCEETALAGWWPARWVAVPAAEHDQIFLEGRTLAELVDAARQAHLDAPTDHIRGPQAGPPG